MLDPDSARVIGDNAVEHHQDRILAVARRRVDRRRKNRDIGEIRIKHAVTGVTLRVAIRRGVRETILRGMAVDVVEAVVVHIACGPHVTPHGPGLVEKLLVVVDGQTVVEGASATGTAEIGRARPNNAFGVDLIAGEGVADDEDPGMHDRAVQPRQAGKALALLANLEGRVAQLGRIERLLQRTGFVRLRGLAVDDSNRDSGLCRRDEGTPDTMGVLHPRDRQINDVCRLRCRRSRLAGPRIDVGALDESLKIVQQ